MSIKKSSKNRTPKSAIASKLFTLFSVFFMSMALFSAPAQAEKKEIEFVDLEGNPSKLSDYRGKWVIVNLWATWCPPCLAEIPDLVMFHEKHADLDAVVLGINYEDLDPKKVKNFAEDQMINYPVLRFTEKPNGQSTPFGVLRGLPTTYMVTPEGDIVAARTGLVDSVILEEFIKKYNEIK